MADELSDSDRVTIPGLGLTGRIFSPMTGGFFTWFAGQTRVYYVLVDGTGEVRTFVESAIRKA